MFSRSRVARTRFAAMLGCLSVAVLGVALTATTSSAATSSATARSAVAGPAAAIGWTTTFRDDFSGTGLPNPADWMIDLGTSYPGGPAQFGTGEIETLTNSPANVNVRNGSLYITPRRDAGGNWTSARIETNRANFKPAAGGTMEASARIQMPNVTGPQAAGYWPAFWMLGSPYRADRWSWPGIGELDIMENVQGVSRNWGTLHCGVWGGPCNEPEGISNNGVACPGATCQSAFHVYSFQWDRSGTGDQMRWYTDGQLSHKVDQREVPAGTWDQLTVHAGYFMILNVAVGGVFPAKLGGGPTPATLPGVPMIVDYVQVRYTGGGGGTTTVPTIPTTAATLTTRTTPTTPTTPTTATTSSSTSPGTGPSALAVTSTTASSITLGWKGNAGISYDVLRSGVRIATVTGLRFTDVGLNKNTPYLYSVRGAGVTTAQIAATISDSAVTGTTTPPRTTPTTATPTSASPGGGPSGLHSTGTTANSITLGWTGSATAGYEVLRSGVRIATVTGTRFTDVGLNANTPYLYSVRGAGITTPTLLVTIP